jgi:predicted cupin superfamily sugar epimerase
MSSVSPNTQQKPRSLTAQELIAHLQLSPLPGEGGFYRETYRTNTALGNRAAGTAILYLLTAETVSRFHRLKQDEVWHFYQGDAVELVLLHDAGTQDVITLGTALTEGQLCQAVVPAHTWQGARVKPGGEWALLGCTVAPGFEFDDWELADASLVTSHNAALAWPQLLAAMS